MRLFWRLCIVIVLSACTAGGQSAPSETTSCTRPSPSASVPTPSKTTTTLETADFCVEIPSGMLHAKAKRLNRPRGKVAAIVYEIENILIITYEPGVDLGRMTPEDAQRFMLEDVRLTNTPHKGVTFRGQVAVRGVEQVPDTPAAQNLLVWHGKTVHLFTVFAEGAEAEKVFQTIEFTAEVGSTLRA